MNLTKIKDYQHKKKKNCMMQSLLQNVGAVH
jgi:hypothetical protein